MKNTIIIQNLKCGGCASTIIKKISKLKGISNVEVNNEINSVSFEAENERDVTTAKEELKALGYPSIEDDNFMLTKAKSFISCASGRINSENNS